MSSLKTMEAKECLLCKPFWRETKFRIFLLLLSLAVTNCDQFQHHLIVYVVNMRKVWLWEVIDTQFMFMSSLRWNFMHQIQSLLTLRESASEKNEWNIEFLLKLIFDKYAFCEAIQKQLYSSNVSENHVPLCTYFESCRFRSKFQTRSSGENKCISRYWSWCGFAFGWPPHEAKNSMAF